MQLTQRRSADRSRAARPLRRRRQWGTDRTGAVLPMMTEPPSRRLVSTARFALVGTVAAWVAYVVEQSLRLSRSDLSVRSVCEAVAYLVIVTLLTGSATAYLLTRLGYLERARAHRRVSRAVIDACIGAAQPSMTVLIPSYREDSRVVRQTLLSAALQEYPDLRVVLLIDDPVAPTDPEHLRLLREARDLPSELELLLERPRQLFTDALISFEARCTTPDADTSPDDLLLLAEHYDAAVDTLQAEVDGYDIVDHSDEFLCTEVLGRLIADLSTTAHALRSAAGSGGARISLRRTAQLYRRLVWIFSAELSSFERKQFASLSHEANKAMNLNSYIGLMGGTYRVERSVGGDVMLPVNGPLFDLSIPDPDYVLTLDADSMLLPEYCLRLVAFMEQPANANIGVVQTPYSSYRGASHRIERIAGATTDLQHIAHQGMTAYGATFWVGANAVLRKVALDQIAVEEDERGFVVKRYVQDRTVIEDTESSIDLRAAGWQLHNYPERLSYSATPPDFGSLVVQRQRWANGGLVILPKMLRLMGRRRAGSTDPTANPAGDANAIALTTASPKALMAPVPVSSARGRRLRPAELFLRLNYLASVTWSSVGLLVLLCYPFDNRLLSRLALLTALPYFAAMASDLRRSGYKRTDVLRLYGFNLLLLPVNLSGTVQSVVQAIGGQKIAFARTPKVANRTVAPLSFVLVPLVVVAWSAYTFARDLHEASYIHAGFAAVNGLLTLYAVVAFVGLRNTVADVLLNLRERMYRPARPTAVEQSPPDWVTVLYHGTAQPAERQQVEPLAVALAARDQTDRPAVTASDAMALIRTATGHAMPYGTDRRRPERRGRRWHGIERRRSERVADESASGELERSGGQATLVHVPTAGPGAPEPLRFEAGGHDVGATAELLAECLRILSARSRVTIRPQGDAIEVFVAPRSTRLDLTHHEDNR